MTPNFDRLVARMPAFHAELAAMKQSLDPKFPWIPWPILHTVRELAPLVTEEFDYLFGGDKWMADIGGADGDLAFFLNREGNPCDLYDYGPLSYDMKGAKILRKQLGSGVNIYDIDLNTPPYKLATGYHVLWMVGVLYHLQNPYEVMRSCTEAGEFMFLGTRIAKRFTANGPDMSAIPAAYLLGPDESNGDSTNYWVFTEAGLRRLCERTGWEIIGFRTTGVDDSTPYHADRDQRALAFLRRR